MDSAPEDYNEGSGNLFHDYEKWSKHVYETNNWRSKHRPAYLEQRMPARHVNSHRILEAHQKMEDI